MERRQYPRVKVDCPVDIVVNSKSHHTLSLSGKTIDISEGGICFDCERPALPDNILLSIDSASFKLKQPANIPARVVWHKTLVEDRSQFGAQFSSLDREFFLLIRDFIFDNFAQKASFFIGDINKKAKVQDFFNQDVRRYHEDLSILAQEIEEGRIKSEEAEKRLTTLTNELLLKGNVIEKTLNNNISVKKIKQLFRELVGCWYYKSPIMKMAYERPRGYPGDFELFEIIYKNEPLTEDKSIGFYLDRYFLNNEYAKAARARKNRMKNILQDLIENTNLSTVRMLNIACGPSREIRELFSEPLFLSEISGKKIIFTGLDNDKDALEFSNSSLSNLPPNIETRFLNENVLDIFRNAKYYDLIGKQDIIYILGLTEYLPDRIFKKLVKFLFQLLNDKGVLVITYKDEDVTFPSIGPDWIADWSFIKRSKDDLITAAEELGVGKYSLKIEKEGTGAIFFLTLTKA